MTVSSEAASATFTGNGAQTVFSYSFPILSKGDADLYVTPVGGAPALADPSTWSLASSGGGGTITYPLVGAPAAAGVVLTLVRSAAYVQPTNLGNQGAYLPIVVERSFDYVTMLLQQVVQQQQRTIRGSVAEAALPELPARTARANGVVGFDASGDLAIVSGTLPAGSYSAYMGTVLLSADAAAARTAFGATATGSALFTAADAAAARTALGAGAVGAALLAAATIGAARAAVGNPVFTPEEFNILPANADNRLGFAALAAAMQAAGGGAVTFPANQTYNCFDDGFTPGITTLFALSNCKGIRIDMCGSMIRTTRDWAADATVCNLFQFTDCEDVKLVFRALQATGTTTDTFLTGHTGASFAGRCRGVEVDCQMTGGRGGVEVVRGGTFAFAHYAEGFVIRANCDHVFYPVSLQRNGRSVEIDLVSRNAGRSLFLGNATDIEARVWTDNALLYDDIVIVSACLPGEGIINNACDNIALTVTHRPAISLSPGVSSLVTLVFQQYDAASELNPGRLSNINVRVDCDYTGAAAMPSRLFYCAVQKANSNAATDPTAHQILDIKFGGTVIGLTGAASNLCDLWNDGSPAIVGAQAFTANISVADLTVFGTGTPGIVIRRDVIKQNLKLRDIYAPLSTVTWNGTLPIGVLDASENVNTANLKSLVTGTTGYQLLPNGRMRQWGVTTVAAGPTNVAATFPAAFRAAPAGAVITCQTSGTTDVVNASVSATQITFNRPGGASPANFYWEVEGDL